MRTALAISLLLLARAAQACSCIQLPAEHSFEDAALVFSGVVENIEASSDPAWRERRVTLRVMQWWKGEQLERTIEVHTGLGGGDCGYPFERGQSYLVFASRANGTSYTGICSGTAALVCVINKLEALGEPIKVYERVDRKTLIAREQPYTTYWRPCIEPAALIGERGLQMNKHCMFVVDGVIDRQGNVRDLQVKPGERYCPSETQIAEHIATWRFRPATLDGIPIETRLTRVSMREPYSESDHEKERH